MRKAKRKRLEAAGWKVGTVQEFLGLTDAEAELVELRVALAEALYERRSRRRLTQQQVARGIRSSQSRVAKMEAGADGVSLDLLVLALLKLGVTRRELARIIAPPRRRRAA
jgi:predicted XRE-type DNA-binding protein